MSASVAIRDDLIEHDIDLRRVDGDVRNAVRKRLSELGKELVAIVASIDAHGAARADTRQKRLKEIEKKGREATQAAYRDIHKLVSSTSKQVATLESEKVIDVIRKNVP